MINSQRKKEIIEYLSDTDYRTLKDIADKFAISMNTARRDINELAEENLVKKFYGGVSLARKKDSTFQSRIASHIEEKQRIAKYAAALVNDNDLLYIDSGSTTSLLSAQGFSFNNRYKQHLCYYKGDRGRELGLDCCRIKIEAFFLFPHKRV